MVLVILIRHGTSLEYFNINIISHIEFVYIPLFSPSEPTHAYTLCLAERNVIKCQNVCEKLQVVQVSMVIKLAVLVAAIVVLIIIETLISDKSSSCGNSHWNNTTTNEHMQCQFFFSITK